MNPNHISSINTQNLSKYYGDFAAVEALNFSVKAGQIVGLLGPNGAGKTTVLRMLAGILQPTSGHIQIAGFSTETQPFEVKKRIGFLSNDTQLYLRLTPREVLRFFGRLHGMRKAALEQRIDTLVTRFDMHRFANRHISTLSSGQKQRVNIARCIVHQPSVLILDEVTTALDVISSQFIMDFLREARDQGAGILFSTHIMSEAEYLCDEILLIHQGRIIGHGSPQSLIAHTQAENLTAAFLKHIQEMPS